MINDHLGGEVCRSPTSPLRGYTPKEDNGRRSLGPPSGAGLGLPLVRPASGSAAHACARRLPFGAAIRVRTSPARHGGQPQAAAPTLRAGRPVQPCGCLGALAVCGPSLAPSSSVSRCLATWRPGPATAAGASLAAPGQPAAPACAPAIAARARPSLGPRVGPPLPPCGPGLRAVAGAVPTAVALARLSAATVCGLWCSGSAPLPVLRPAVRPCPGPGCGCGSRAPPAGRRLAPVQLLLAAARPGGGLPAAAGAKAPLPSFLPPRPPEAGKARLIRPAAAWEF